MKPEFDIAIVGGGLIGEVLALSLAGQGLRLAIIDSGAGSKKVKCCDGFAYALSISTCRCLEVIGLGQALRKHGQNVDHIRVSDGRPGEGPGPVMLEFDGREAATEPMSIMLESHFLNQAVDEEIAKKEDIKRIIPATVAGLGHEAAMVSLLMSDTRDVTATLAVGCDGAHSTIANLAGVARRTKEFRQIAITCSIEHDRPHNGTACQVFLPAGPVAVLPLRGNRSCIVWTESAERGNRLADTTDSEFLTELHTRIGDYLGEFRILGERSYWPLHGSQTSGLTAHRVALAGDAAHLIHPLAGQGLNLGLRDAATLAEIVVSAKRRGEDFGSAQSLHRYERLRWPDIQAFSTVTGAFNAIYSNDNPCIRTVRRLGMAGLASSGLFRRAAIRFAARADGNLPKLMRGQAL